MKRSPLAEMLAQSAAASALFRGVVHPPMDAREKSRAKQPGRELREFVVTVYKSVNGEKQEVRICAVDDWKARTIAMFYTSIRFGGEQAKYSVIPV